jgi:putative ABC transport system permease protein
VSGPGAGGGGRPAPRPPRLARWLISRVVPAGPSRDGLVGDMDELFADRCEAGGRFVAGLWYHAEAIRAVVRYSGERIRGRVPLRKPTRGRGPGLIETVGLDLRYAARSLRRTPGFTLTAIVTLALGIGGTTAIFTVVDTVLLRPSPWREPGRLVNVWTTYPHWRGEESLDAFWDRIALSYPEYEDWRAGTRLFSETALYTLRGATLTGDGAAERLTVGVGTASLLDVLGVQPVLGRWFLPGEDVEGRRLVVLSDGFWRRRFGADPGVLGSTVNLDDELFTVIGVLPPGFAVKNVFLSGNTGAHDAWLPIGLSGADLSRRGNHSFDAIGRLAEGATLESALAEATPLLRGDAPPERRGVRMAYREEVEVGGLRLPLMLLLAASGVLLLIACGNVATMLLGESLGRRPEMATRAALGAGRRRIARQLLTESVVLGLAGALAGGLAALALTKLIVALGPPLPVARQIAVSPRVLLFASGLGILTGLFFGLAPAASLQGVGLREAMQRGVQGRGRRDWRLQHGVIVFEIALTVVLMVCGGLLARTVLNLVAIDPGFTTEGVAVVEVSALTPRFTRERVSGMYGQALLNIEGLPGVRQVSGVSTLPLAGPSSSTSLDIEGRPEETGNAPGPEGQRRVVFPGYHEVMDIPLLEGRYLEPADGPDAPLSMLISERLARVYWRDRSPIGARVRYDQRWWTVVGIVGDVRHGALDEEPVATFYVPFAQAPMRAMTLVASITGPTASVLPALRDAVRAADADVAITGTHTMESLVSRAAEEERYRAILIAVFAATAAMLAAVGVFGVTARAVARRGAEMGVRLALGARVPALTVMVVGSHIVTVCVGVAIGLIGAGWATRLLSGFLFGVRPGDPATYLAVASVLVGATLVSSWLAARRIGRVDPVEVLRAQ